MKIDYIETNKIKDAKLNSNFVPHNIYQKLKKDIEENGIIYPVILYKNEDETYTIIDGHHRVKVAKELGITKVPAIITEVKSEKEALLKAIKLNTERGEQNPLILATILDEIRQNYNLEEETIYEKNTINDLLDLLKLDYNKIENIKQQQEEEIEFVIYSFVIPKKLKQDLDEILKKFNTPREFIEQVCKIMK